jgi:hypothetical protein
LWALAVCGLWLPQQVRGETEYRDFLITVDGKDSGHSQMTITRQTDGAMVMTSQSVVRISQVVFSYNFNNQTSEWWKDGKLVSLKASTNENKKHSEVSATAEGEGLRLRVNNQDRTSRADLWPNSFWKLADPKYHNKDIPVLEVDTGKEYVCRLQYVDTENMTVAGQTQKCYHFRVIGGPSPVDVWYDRYYLLVRQDFVESGRKISTTVTSIRR